jgi:RHS repeat-associated protein
MLTSVTNALGHTTRIEYDHHHQPSKAIDVRGGEWQWTYDAGGRLTERTLPTGARVSFVWERGLLSKILDPRGQSTELVYDDRKQVTELVLPNGGRTKYEWDELGRVVKTKNAREGTARFQYDAEGRLLESYSMVETLQQHAYDAEGNLLEARRQGRHVRLGYDHYHRPAWREEDGTTVRFEYDTEDRLLAVVNEAGERHTITRDAMGRVSRESGFDGAVREYVRNVCGWATLSVQPSGRTTATSYDLLGRIVENKHSDGTFARYEYDADGLIKRATNETTAVEFERDVLGCVTVERSGAFVVRNHYDILGDKTELSTSVGGRLVIDRNELGLPGRLFFGDADGFREADVRLDYDSMGLERTRLLSNGLSLQWTRDAGGRPLARTTYRRTPTGTSEVSARSLVWRTEDQLATMIDSASGPSFLTHDRRGYLVEERRSKATSARYTDIVGNVYESATSGRRYAPGGRVIASGELTFDYDPDGNRTARTAPSGTTAYRWNGHGLLSEVRGPDGAVHRYEYDAFHRRVRSAVETTSGVVHETLFVWNHHNVVHELDSGTGLTTWHWEEDSYRPIACQQRDRRWFVATDHLGTPTELYDHDGELSWRQALDINGEAEASVTDPLLPRVPWRWQGFYEDEGTGLQYSRHRYYDPDTGSFLSQDPLGLLGGWRGYAYVPDSTTRIDPLGLYDRWEVAPYGRPGHTGDGFDADELLGSIWLRENGHGNRSSAIGRRNPAMAIDPTLHRQITTAQHNAGLFNHASVRAQSAMDNIARNYDVRMGVLTDHFVAQGMTRRAARLEAARRLAPLRADAENFARSIGCG